MKFMGYPRPKGAPGVRNHVLVVSSVSCANGVVQGIGRALPEVKALTHTEGCGRGKDDLKIALRTLVGMGKNPNVAAVLVVGLGCEYLKASLVSDRLTESGKPVEAIDIQTEGGSQKAMARGIEIARGLLEHAAGIRREEFGFGELTIGHECGGSDAFSGVTANPMVGAASDRLVAEGGTVIFSETTEMFGTENILARKAATPEVERAILKLLEHQKSEARRMLGEGALTAISPGNMEGGLTTLAEKSLGCIIKAGTTPIQEVLDYAHAPSKRGVVIMDTPGSDVFSITGMAAGGAQIMVFTTGRGTPVGFPLAPVIKVASNHRIYELMGDDMDLNAAKILDGTSLEEAGEELVEYIREVANGRPTSAEINQQEMFAIHTVGQAF